MKSFFKNIFYGSVALLTLASCTESAIDDLDNIWTAPTVLEMTSLTDSSTEKDGNLRYHSISLTNGSNAMTVTFVGNKYYLEGNTYSPAYQASAKSGNYVIESSSINGKTPESGSIIVTKSGDTYTLDAMIFCTDGTPYRVTWSGDIVYEADPEALVLTQVFSATSNLAYGINSITLELAPSDITRTYNSETYTYDYTGAGNFLALDLYSSDGYIHAGTYTASAVGGTIGEGEFGIGYEADYYGWFTYNAGTLWYTVTDGTATSEWITEGTVTVTRTATGWSIELISGSGESLIWCTFSGAIDAVTAPDEAAGEVEYTELTNLLSASNNVAYGTNSLTLNMATADVTSSYDSSTWSYVYSGTGNYLAMDIYSSDGILHTGSYTACTTGGSIGEGEFGIGYDTEFWGTTYYNWGTCWWTVEDGATSAEKITDGTVDVSLDGDNVVIALQSSLVNARFTYPAADLAAAGITAE